MTAHTMPGGSTTSLSVVLPRGYYELPLDTIHEAVESAESIVEFLPTEVADVFPEVATAIADLLTVLRANNACYCAIGQHAAADGTPVTSWLTISLLDRGRAQNPRVTIAELAAEKATDGRDAHIEPVELGGRTVLFIESTTTYAVVDDSSRAESPGRAVHQIEAIVVADDGARIAVAVLSTADVAYGSDFGAMMVLLAGSITFDTVVHPQFTLAL
ncbi:hypothetical protein [Nocardia canadensis]|uniref:hypothetical protein n=1 Tax=Nocardia canadensis TaxID=3065238 RepID=UPI0029310EBE|nr:hypothetical protein [Nocardia canadensis]